MSKQASQTARLRTRWSAIGAAVAITLGGGGLGLAQAAVGSGDKPITVTVDSERVLDTRVNLGLAGGFASATPRDLQITGSVDVARPNATTAKKTVVPAGATAVLVNVTVVAPTSNGFLTLRPKGAAGAPTTSTVNFVAGAIEPNAATVDLSSDGQMQVWVKMGSATGTADVLVDIVGYTFDHNHDDRYYTEAEVDAAVGAKANTADVYTKTAADAAVAAAVAPKANTADVYTKTAADAAVAAAVAPKANTADVYTKGEVDTAVANVNRVAGITFLSEPFAITNGTLGPRLTPFCPVGQLAIAGGMNANFAGDPGGDAITYSSYPDPTVSNRAWRILFRNTSGSDLSATTYTVCAEVAP